MPRIVKDPDERRAEIVETATALFHEHGYARCSIEMIIRKIGVAKGTFYYYFRSKSEILSAIVDRTLDQIVEAAGQVADTPGPGALAKMEILLSGGHMGGDAPLEVAEILHLPENRELHELTNIQTVLRLSPILARIVEQGNDEGVFACDMPLETVQFLFTGTQFLLDGGLFGFTEDEVRARRRAAQSIIERALGAGAGSFGFLNPEGAPVPQMNRGQPIRQPADASPPTGQRPPHERATE